MKRIILFIGIIALLVCMCAVTVNATDVTTEVATDVTTEVATDVTTEVATDVTTEAGTETTIETMIETVTETIIESETETTAEKDILCMFSKEDADKIISIIENASSNSEVILAIIEMCGCTPEEAEHILNTFIALGDKYCGENELWVGFKKDVQENTKFWAVAISCGASWLAIMAFTLILIGKTNPAVRRAMFGMSESLKVSDRMSKATSETLAKMESRFNEAMDKLQKYEEVIKGKEDQIISLSRHIETLKTAIKKERSNLLYAAMNNLRMIKLVIDRTTMPMSDKATVDHWYAKGTDAIMEELNPEEKKYAAKMLSMLDEVGAHEEQES